MPSLRSKFSIGELVYHKLFDYRGVIVDVDPEFAGSEEWYDMMALSKPPRDKPWYKVLVHESVHTTYVAEQNLKSDPSGDPIIHPEIDNYFLGFKEGVYLPRQLKN